MEETEDERVLRIFIEGQATRHENQMKSIVDGDTLKVRFPATWDYGHSPDLAEILPQAIELGWKENKVQVKRYQMAPGTYAFYIEPYEEDCGCSSLLKYEDYV